MFSPSWINLPCKVSAADFTIVMCLRTTSTYPRRVSSEEQDSAVILEFLGQITKTSYSNIKHAPKRKRSTRLVWPKLPSLDFRRKSYCTTMGKIVKSIDHTGIFKWLIIHSQWPIHLNQLSYTDITKRTVTEYAPISGHSCHSPTAHIPKSRERNYGELYWYMYKKCI